MKIRYLGHSCVEILGKHHILIDPDFTRNPLPDVEYICVSHAHKDHIGKVAQIPTGMVLASQDVCNIALKMGVPSSRLQPVTAGERIENIDILPGFSVVKDPVYFMVSLFFRFKFPDPGGTPLSFLIHDDSEILHIGDAHQFPPEIHPDILCLPWRTSPVGPERYKSVVIEMAKKMAVPYILPIHYDLDGTEANPNELISRIDSVILNGEYWHTFANKELVKN